MIEACLEDLEQRIDTGVEDSLYEEWSVFLDGRFRGDHYIGLLSEMPGLYAVAMPQPECNDMEAVFRHTVDKDIPLIGFPRSDAEAARQGGRSLHGRVHCW